VTRKHEPVEVDRVTIETDDAKIVGRFFDDGSAKTDTYFRGEKAPDGPGHGHAVVDDGGKVNYLREASADAPSSTRKERVSLDDRARERDRGR
jgi:hypothetical protein